MFYNVPSLVMRHGKFEGIDQFANSHRDRSEVDQFTKPLREIVDAQNALYVDTYDVFCDSAICPIFTSHKKLVYYDRRHWTLEGADLFGEKFKSSSSNAAMIVFGERSEE